MAHFVTLDFTYSCFMTALFVGSTNFIENGFYDVGQLRPDTKFLTLEEYARQEMNDKRPIILVNAKLE